jgi:glycosyltransferase involved in cell wall biosynthesis
MKIVVISHFYPIMTNSGGSIGVYGMGDCLRSIGNEVEYVFVGTKQEFEKNSGKSDFNVHYSEDTNLQNGQALLKHVLKTVRPDLVWIHPIAAWAVFKPFAQKYPHIVMAGDPMDRIIRFRFKFSAEANKYWFLKPFYKRKNLKEAQDVLNRDMAYLRECNERGVCSAYGPGDIDYHRKQAGVPVELCELAFPDLGARSGYSGKTNFLLLGNLTTIHTRYGLDYFFKDIWPKWKKDKLTTTTEIRLVGAGKMSTRIKVPENQKGFVYVGFAESLEQEFNDTLASLVLVPIDIGFRTRVIECWMKGVPVIMDDASAKGLPVVDSGVNCLVAKSPEDFIAHAHALENDEKLRNKIGEGGRSTFLNYYLSKSPSSIARYASLVDQAMEKFKKTRVISQ